MSSNDIAIKVENISKRYRIGLKEEMNENFAGTIFNFIKSPLRNFRKYRSLYKFEGVESPQDSDPNNNTSNIIWALRDVSFDVKKGQVLGIIGSNGAGKSTLLKIFSKITEPTYGRAEIQGKVSSLLEVGTGFHPELTGRENIYLNGTILGMRKKEIDSKFDKIVDFSGVEKFIDTPVKRYSSGMQVRLAFSVAAHLEPDILIVDEVLAVGDVAFQKKCIGKMGEVARGGRTILFVSHNMGAIENLCTSAMWMNDGKILTYGDVTATIDAYLKSTKTDQTNPERWNRSGTGEALVLDVRLLDADDADCDIFKMGETIVVEFTVEFYRSFESIDVAVQIKRTDTGLSVLHLINQDSGFFIQGVLTEKHKYRVEVPDCSLYPSSYEISIWVGTREIKLDYVKDVLAFSIVQSNVSRRTTPFFSHLGILHVMSNWKEV